MTRLLGAALAIALISSPAGAARADQKEADAALDKAIKALGGAEKLEKADAVVITAKGTIKIQGNENELTWKTTIQGTDHMRNEFNGDQFQGVFVIAGDKGWGKFGENDTNELQGDFLDSQRQSVYLSAVVARPTLLKGKGFKYESAGEDKVGGKPAVALKCTGPDGKAFTLLLDKESGLPLATRTKAKGFNGEEFDQESTFADYKDFDGIKRPTKIEIKRDGEPFVTQTVTDVKVLDKVPDDTFAAPK
jgi:hypothetical protein